MAFAAVRYLLVLIAAITLFPGPAQADDVSDHERARAAVEKGDIVALAFILEKVESIYEGSIIEVELEDEGDEGFENESGTDADSNHFMSGFIYEIKLLTPQGNLLKLKLDARTAELIEVRGHGEEKARKNIQIPEREQEP
ncbi:MAG: hypothetical protein ISR53_01580 [Rhodospirillales bacterium]|nr:hypothetical protein [Rhodospirillales bacterium]